MNKELKSAAQKLILRYLGKADGKVYWKKGTPSFIFILSKYLKEEQLRNEHERNKI